jgi:hypothetical protein
MLPVTSTNSAVTGPTVVRVRTFVATACRSPRGASSGLLRTSSSVVTMIATVTSAPGRKPATWPTLSSASTA